MAWNTQPRVLEVVGNAIPEYYGQKLFEVIRCKGMDKVGRLFNYWIDVQTIEANGLFHSQINELVRAYVGLEYGWELELRIKRDQATPAQLGDYQQLGWTSWLGESPSDEPIVGMRFEPELYVDQLVRNRKKGI